MTSAEQHRRVIWHSRRGMLELDKLLIPFATGVFLSLTENEQDAYVRFIAHEDTVLFHWLINHGEPQNPEFQAVIKQIKRHAKTYK